ncbi:lipopolysaccharide cholinephosphotransferase licd [Holotrichia oblita]|nr:lipopolysaccharide cholinephosphotransferase licd [Holotrichia oblita]
MCDKLIVGVTTDELTQYKNKKPVIPFEYRLEVVRSVKYVDTAVPQSTMDKIDAWHRFRFDIMFVGDDWYQTDKWQEFEAAFKEIGVRIVYFPYTTDVYLESDCKVEPILLNNEQQRMLKDVMTELLLVMHQICEKHGIKYYLYGGTLLGAIRHKGFIPWDDDIDVVMFREEYDRFFKICESELPKEYYITPSENKLTPMITHKLRKCNTVRRYVQKDEHLREDP